MALKHHALWTLLLGYEANAHNSLTGKMVDGI